MSLAIVNGDAVLVSIHFTPTKCLHQPGAVSLNGDAVLVSISLTIILGEPVRSRIPLPPSPTQRPALSASIHQRRIARAGVPSP